MERIKVDEKIFHESCLKCSHYKSQTEISECVDINKLELKLDEEVSNYRPINSIFPKYRFIHFKYGSNTRALADGADSEFLEAMKMLVLYRDKSDDKKVMEKISEMLPMIYFLSSKEVIKSILFTSSLLPFSAEILKFNIEENNKSDTLLQVVTSIGTFELCRISDKMDWPY